MIKIIKMGRDYKQLNDTCICTSLNEAREISLKLVQGEKWDSCAEKFVTILFQSFSTTLSVLSVHPKYLSVLFRKLKGTLVFLHYLKLLLRRIY